MLVMLKKLLLLSLLAALIALVWQLGWLDALTFDNLKRQQGELVAFRDAQPLLVSGLYFLVYVGVTALSLPGATIMTLAGGAVFGLGWGLLLVSFASTLGATLAMLVSRFLLRGWVKQRFSKTMQKLDAGIEKEGAFYLFALRLVPAFPFFVINLAMGLTRIKVSTYWWVSQVGMLAGTVVYVNAGTQLAQIAGPGDVLSLELLVSFALLGLFPLLARKLLNSYQNRKKLQGWKRPPSFDTNLLVIGAGSGGLVAAYIAAAVKARVTLVEKHQMGGDCLNTGCVPSKALIRSARLAQEMREAENYGLKSREPEIDFQQVMARIQQVIQQIEPHDSVERYTGLGVEVKEGSARLVSPWEVEVTLNSGEVQRITSRSIVLATGAEPFVPDLPGLDDVDYLTSDNLWQLREQPERLLVLGGGPIGCELSQAFQRLGSQVTQVEQGPQLLPREDRDASDAVLNKMQAEGVAVKLEHQALRVEVRDRENLLIATNPEGEEVAFAFDRLLVAVGRKPRLKGYGLEELGLVPETGKTLETNAYLQTLFPNIYACGDLVGPYQLTHAASHQARHATVNALFGHLKSFKVDYTFLPWATFTDPEVARVGLNEKEAKEQKIDYEVTLYGIDDLDRALADSQAYGFVKVLTPPGKDKILGVTLVGLHAGDLLAEFVLAMKHGLGMNKLLGTIHIYPTLTEANKSAAGNWKKAHAPEGVLRWLKKYHEWRLN
ncbi:FAD-dependent oxidoreductase [Marinospirillum sp.]|uniref:FAD-dependent oxidoreductase n=1 Tax=Marinospirillum sp. TaxID=2183934 RepID=UPI0028707CF4|nr:FAD-dependent oxidoreductase [Marinospirillum sp.]MDR9468960.1 FAD-dependent oxidoreductase [Marinospirillum sp.]